MYTTYDVYVIAYIMLETGRRPEMDMNARGVVVFSYEETPDVLRLIDMYSKNNPAVDITKYVQNIKELKGEVFKMKDANRRTAIKNNFN